MSFPRYPAYKDSGVEWLGKVPGHWEVQPCRAVVQERTAKNEGAECEDYLSLMANVGVMPYAEKGDVGNKKPDDLSKCKIVTQGDLVINSMNYGIGSYGLSAYSGVCSPIYIVLTPKNDVIESRFAFRIFENKAFQTFAQSFGNGILEHRCAINWDILKPIGVPVPPQSEQQAILAVLDRETAKIDVLVAEQRRLMALLKEKRQAVISHAVTRGLNPHAPMKPSGIEWLGDVPEHWSVVKLGRHATVTKLTGFEYTNHWKVDPDGEIVALRGYNIKNGKLDLESVDRISHELSASLDRSKLRAGDIVFPCTGTIGDAAIIPEDDRFHINQNIAKITFDHSVQSEYALWFLTSAFAKEQFQDLNTSGVQPVILIGNIRRLLIVVPSLNEQSRISEYLSAAGVEFDTLTTEAQRAIDMLQERRTALISAAVTGQIDVRGTVSII